VVGTTVELDGGPEGPCEFLLHPVDATDAHLRRANERNERRERGVVDEVHPPVGVEGLLDHVVVGRRRADSRQVVVESESLPEYRDRIDRGLPLQSVLDLSHADHGRRPLHPDDRLVPVVTAEDATLVVHPAVGAVPEVRLPAFDGRLEVERTRELRQGERTALHTHTWTKRASGFDLSRWNRAR